MALGCSSRGERTRSVWRARGALAEACAEDAQDSSLSLQRRLERAVSEIKRQLAQEVPSWIETRKGKQTIRMPLNYFVHFGEQVVRTIHRWSEHEIKKRAKDWQNRLDQSSMAYHREFDVYNERQAKGAKLSRMVDRRCPEQELYLYEPIQYWDLDQQDIMRAIIDLRLGRILPHLAESRETAALRLQLAEDEEEEEEDEGEDAEETKARRNAERARRRRLNEDLKDRQAHEKSMAELGRLASSLESRKAELLRQLQNMSKKTETAEADCEQLQRVHDQLQRDVDMKSERRKLELEERSKIMQQRAEKLKEKPMASPRNLNVTTVKAPIKVVSPRAAPIDQEEIMRRVKEFMKAIQAEQAKERSKLEAKIKELEVSIARLKLGDAARQNWRPEKTEKNEPPSDKEEMLTQFLACKVNAARKNTSERDSIEAPAFKNRRIFDKLHEDASDRVTRFVVRKSVVAGNANSNNFRMDSSSKTPEATSSSKRSSCGAFFAAEAQLSVARRRTKSLMPTSSAEMATALAKTAGATKRQSFLVDSEPRPSSAAKVATIGKPPEPRPSSAAKVASIGKPPDVAARVRRGSSATTRQPQQHRASLQPVARPTEDCGVPKYFSEDSKAMGPTPTQFGASVLYSRVPSELAGPVRTPLLRTTLDQHHQHVVSQ